MNSIIKARCVDLSERRATVRSAESMAGTSPGADVGQDEIVALKAIVSSLKAELADQRSLAERGEVSAYERGLAEGMSRGAHQARSMESERVAAIRQGADSAVQSFERRLASTETLAIDIALHALGRIMTQPEDVAMLVAQTIRRHVRELAAEAVVAIEVSGDDFPSEESQLPALSELPGYVRSKIAVRAELPSGACLIHLMLGSVDIGLNTQWKALESAMGAFRD